MSALRFWTAFAILLPLLLASGDGWPKLRPRDWGYTVLLALSGLVVYNLLFLGALERIPAGRTALVVALNAGTVGFMLSHARLSFERYRITGEIEDLTAQERRLELEIDRLRVERAFRADNVDLAVEAAELGLQPVQPGQVWVVNQGAAQ